MCTKARFYENLIRVASAPKKQVLTDVVLETLSIIAYKQPVTKMEIEKIRGVKSDHAVNRLVEYNLVYEAGGWTPRGVRLCLPPRGIPAPVRHRIHRGSAGAGAGTDRRI